MCHGLREVVHHEPCRADACDEPVGELMNADKLRRWATVGTLHGTMSAIKRCDVASHAKITGWPWQHRSRELLV